MGMKTRHFKTCADCGVEVTKLKHAKRDLLCTDCAVARVIAYNASQRELSRQWQIAKLSKSNGKPSPG